MSESGDLSPIIDVSTGPADEPAVRRPWDQTVRTVALVVVAVALVLIASAQIRSARLQTQTTCAQRAFAERSLGGGTPTDTDAIQRQVANCYK